MVITIDTGYQNRPSWLWQTTSFITGSHAHSVLWQARDPGGGDDFFFFFFFACQLSIPNQTVYPRSTILQQGMHLNVFSKVYCDRVYFSCAERNMTGSGFDPPLPQRHPPIQLRSRVPPPPPGKSLPKRTHRRTVWTNYDSENFPYPLCDCVFFPTGMISWFFTFWISKIETSCQNTESAYLDLLLELK